MTKKFLLLMLIIGLPGYQEYFNKAISSYVRGNYQNAIDDFKKSYALKKHSKSSYYIAMSYFQLEKDSLASIYSALALNDNPQLADSCYENLNYIRRYYQLSTRFKYIHFHATNSIDDDLDDRRGRDSISLYYWISSPESQKQLLKDFQTVQDRQPPHLLTIKKDSIM